ncbi:hypothetical protein MSAN_02535000 [Mycena sanguinolenta]|uniref:Uncharacterized protein n=1 Tax=Mycena sanguinolenta TaxID=230812 RepID=A0A8H6TT31_9AGAR|nr:hypothetical protein MSAN_02535000 [Mycena sanguinolenta]
MLSLTTTYLPIPSPSSIILPSESVDPSVAPAQSSSPSRAASQSPRNSSTASASAPRLVAQVQLVLPPIAAFYPQGGPIGIIHPVMGMQSAQWVEDVFPTIK